MAHPGKDPSARKCNHYHHLNSSLDILSQNHESFAEHSKNLLLSIHLSISIQSWPNPSGERAHPSGLGSHLQHLLRRHRGTKPSQQRSTGGARQHVSTTCALRAPAGREHPFFRSVEPSYFLGIANIFRRNGSVFGSVRHVLSDSSSALNMCLEEIGRSLTWEAFLGKGPQFLKHPGLLSQHRASRLVQPLPRHVCQILQLLVFHIAPVTHP